MDRAFANLGLKYDAETTITTLSLYATKNALEAFAEAMSDAKKGKKYKEVLKIVKGGF